MLEFSLNDAEDAPFASPWRAAYERLLRTLLALPLRPALLQLHHFRRVPACTPTGLAFGCLGRQPWCFMCMECVGW